MRSETFSTEPQVNDIVKIRNLTGTKNNFNNMLARVLEVRGTNVRVVIEDGKDFWIEKSNVQRVLKATEIEK